MTLARHQKLLDTAVGPRAVENDCDQTAVVVSDLPEKLPITNTELEAIEAYLGQALGHYLEEYKTASQRNQNGERNND